MRKFIKKNYVIIDNIQSFLGVCFVMAHFNKFIFFSPIWLPVVIVTLSLNIVLTYFEELETRANCIVSEKYKKGAIHSFFNPFSWEKEWKHHLKYFSTLVKHKKIFNPFYFMGYILVLLPARAWMNFLFFYHGQMLVMIILTLWYFLQIFVIFNFIKWSLALIFCILFIGNFYLLGVKTLHDQNSHFKQKIIDLCVDEKSKFFFLGNTFFNWRVVFTYQNAKRASTILSGAGVVGWALHNDQLDVETKQSNMLKNNIDIKKALGEPITYQEELDQVKKTLKPLPERVMDNFPFKKEDK